MIDDEIKDEVMGDEAVDDELDPKKVKEDGDVSLDDLADDELDVEDSFDDVDAL